MSLLAKLQAVKEEGRRPSLAPKSPEPDPRRPSMAVRNLMLPAAGQGPRRQSSVGLAGPRTGSMSLGPGRPGPSLLGLLASKRLARKLTTRFFNRRMHGSRASTQGIPIQQEPSYRMEPHRKFHAERVEEVIKDVLEERLEKIRYSPKICPNICKMLSDDIKDRVKQLNFDRYKIVCNVLIGQKKGEGVMAGSRCAWDEKLDDFASYTFQNEHIFCTATVFGVYAE